MSVILLSGGMDSVVLLHWVVQMPHLFGLPKDARHLAMHFRTGIALDDTLSELCLYHCDLLGVPLKEVSLEGLWNDGARARGEAPQDSESPVVAVTVPEGADYWVKDYDYQNGRAMLFFTHCAIEASRRDMGYVFVGYQQEEEEADSKTGDWVPLDSGPEFVYAFDDLMDAGGFLPGTKPLFRMPFIDLKMRKCDIAILAGELGVDLSKTLSCEFTYPPCGKCCSCTRRQRGLEAARG